MAAPLRTILAGFASRQNDLIEAARPISLEVNANVTEAKRFQLAQHDCTDFFSNQPRQFLGGHLDTSNGIVKADSALTKPEVSQHAFRFADLS